MARLTFLFLASHAFLFSDARAPPQFAGGSAAAAAVVPKGWSAHTDQSTGKEYYVNHADGTTSWQPPPHMQVAEPEQTQAAEWREILDPQGRPYYVHLRTGESTYEPPPGTDQAGGATPLQGEEPPLLSSDPRAAPTQAMAASDGFNTPAEVHADVHAAHMQLLEEDARKSELLLEVSEAANLDRQARLLAEDKAARAENETVKFENDLRAAVNDLHQANQEISARDEKLRVMNRELDREKVTAARLVKEIEEAKKRVQESKDKDASIKQLTRQIANFERESATRAKDTKRLELQISTLRKDRRSGGWSVKSILPWYWGTSKPSIPVPSTKDLDIRKLNDTALDLNGTVRSMNETIAVLEANNSALEATATELQELVAKLNTSVQEAEAVGESKMKRLVQGLVEAQDDIRLHAEARIEASEARSTILREKLAERGEELQAAQHRSSMLSDEVAALHEDLKDFHAEVDELQLQRDRLAAEAAKSLDQPANAQSSASSTAEGEVKGYGDDVDVASRGPATVVQEEGGEDGDDAGAVAWSGWLEKRRSLPLHVMRFTVNQYQWRYIVLNDDSLQIWTPPVDARSSKSSFPGRFLRMVTGKLEGAISDGRELAERLDETGFSLKATVHMSEILKCDPMPPHSTSADNGFEIVTRARTWRFKATIPGAAANLASLIKAGMSAVATHKKPAAIEQLPSAPMGEEGSEEGAEEGAEEDHEPVEEAGGAEEDAGGEEEEEEEGGSLSERDNFGSECEVGGDDGSLSDDGYDSDFDMKEEWR